MAAVLYDVFHDGCLEMLLRRHVKPLKGRHSTTTTANSSAEADMYSLRINPTTVTALNE